MTCPLKTPNCTGKATAYGNGIADVWVEVPCGCDNPEERLARLALEALLDAKGDYSCPSVLRRYVAAYAALGGDYFSFSAGQIARWPFLVRWNLVSQRNDNCFLVA